MSTSIVVSPACKCKPCTEADALTDRMDCLSDELEHAERYERAGLKSFIFSLWKKARALRSRCKRRTA
jgi:hypothetical protein